MAKVTVLRGYSASGKSTWAKASGAFIVSRDHIRQQITGSTVKTALDSAGEQLVSKMETAQIVTALQTGVNVVVDNTNLRARDARRYLDLAVKHGAEWEVKDFLVPLDACLARNEWRANGVPPSVIETQAKRFPLGRWPVLAPSVDAAPVQWEPYVPDTSLPPAWVFDIDGTLAELAEGYSPYDPEHYPHDAPIAAVIEALGNHKRGWTAMWDNSIILLSGRGAEHREATEAWLHKHGIESDELFMRPEGDKRNDAIVKSELFDKHLRDRYHVLGVYDDRDRVVAMWRARNIPCFQVNYGDF